jgi:hypothetical protein
MGVNYPVLPAWTGPRLLDYTQSAEIDAQFFFSGTPWDMVARNYTALTLNLANNSTLTQYDVTGRLSLPSRAESSANATGLLERCDALQ